MSVAAPGSKIREWVQGTGKFSAQPALFLRWCTFKSKNCCGNYYYKSTPNL